MAPRSAAGLPGLRKLCQRLRDAGVEVLIVNGEGVAPADLSFPAGELDKVGIMRLKYQD